MKTPLDPYVRWALKQERYMLWGFWVPMVVILVVAALVTAAIY